MCLQNMITIGTLLFATGNIKVALSYHIAVEPESSLQYNGHIVSIFSFYIIILLFDFVFHFLSYLVVLIFFTIALPYQFQEELEFCLKMG